YSSSFESVLYFTNHRSIKQVYLHISHKNYAFSHFTTVAFSFSDILCNKSSIKTPEVGNANSGAISNNGIKIKALSCNLGCGMRNPSISLFSQLKSNMSRSIVRGPLSIV